MARFELNRLASYDDVSLLEELRRVAAIIDSDPLTQREFDRHAKVSSSCLRRRFGSWRDALIAAGLGDRYSGRTVSKKMQVQIAKRLSDEQLLNELRQVATKIGTDSLTQEDFNNASARVNAKGVVARFGSWKAALEKSGLRLSNRGRRHSEEDYFENLLAVWTHHGRQPRYREMNEPPSRITSGAYEKKWGTWKNALLAFVQKVNANIGAGDVSTREDTTTPLKITPKPERPKKPLLRSISIGLRYEVLRRDRFRCVLCGASPSTDLACKLHVDHIVPVARDGKTELDNLRTLCANCNLGKSDKSEK